MSDPDSIGDRLLVIFDGQCGLCNKTVRWFLVRDRRDRLRFVASSSPKVATLLFRHGIDAPYIDHARPNTLLVVRGFHTRGEHVLVRSTGVLALMAELGPPWPFFARIFGWIPRPVRDVFYRLIAVSRYKIWGRLEVCPVPTTAELSHFL